MDWSEWLESKHNTTGAFDNTVSSGSPSIVLIPPSRGVEIGNDLNETEVSQSSIVSICQNLPV